MTLREGKGGHLYLKLDIILEKNVIRVVFQDQAMYARTSFRSAKTCKIGKKRGVFLVILKNFGKDMADKLEKRMQKHVFIAIGFVLFLFLFFSYLKIKGCVFGHIEKFWKGHGGQILKMHEETHIYRVYFHT